MALLNTPGAQAAARWLAGLKLETLPRWYVEIIVLANHGATFDLNVYAEEWGFEFRHGNRASSIRVTDIPFVHGRDDFVLLARTPELLTIRAFMTEVELEHGLVFDRATASVRTNVPHAEAAIRAWLAESAPHKLQR